jgi:hypothetical protein
MLEKHKTMVWQSSEHGQACSVLSMVCDQSVEYTSSILLTE